MYSSDSAMLAAWTYHPKAGHSEQSWQHLQAVLPDTFFQVRLELNEHLTPMRSRQEIGSQENFSCSSAVGAGMGAGRVEVKQM